MCKKGKIFNIQRFSTSDGNGIRTVVFFKGCPLNCVWCHNPESKESATQILHNKDLCIGCGECLKTCTSGAHILQNRLHILKRESCSLCGKCVEKCFSGALQLCGEIKTADEIISAVLRDREFFEQSGGGITLSGGEPLMQYDFALSLLKEAKNSGISTAVETCGFSNRDLSEINQYVDTWLYDVKILDEEEHIKHTGVSNKQILENLNLLNKMGANIVLRCPIIPSINLNEEHFKQIAELSRRLESVFEIHLLLYHPLGISKLKQLGEPILYNNEKFLEKPEFLPFMDALSQAARVPVLLY